MLIKQKLSEEHLNLVVFRIQWNELMKRSHFWDPVEF